MIYNNGSRYWINRVGSLICCCGYRYWKPLR